MQNPLKMLGETYGLTCGQTIISLPTVPTEAKCVYIQVEGQAVRAMFNSTDSVTYGVTKGAGGGALLPANDINNPFYIFHTYDTLNAMRLQSNTDSDATINVIYFGEGQPS